MPIIRRFAKQVIKEAEVDGQETNPDAAQYDDYTVDAGNQAGNQQQPVETENVPQEQPVENDPPQEDTQGGYTTDYTDEGQFPIGDMDGSGEGDYSEDSNPPPESTEEEQPVDELKQTEEEIYSDLTPEQLDIKHKDLKTNYLTMYDTIVGIIERLGDVTSSEDNVPVIEYITSECTRLKDMITDYVNSVYQTRSHTENLINYNRFLAVLAGINKILEEMNKKEY